MGESLGANSRTLCLAACLLPVECGRDLPSDRPRDSVENTVCSYDSNTGAEYAAAPYDTSVRPSAYAHLVVLISEFIDKAHSRVCSY